MRARVPILTSQITPFKRFTSTSSSQNAHLSEPPRTIPRRLRLLSRLGLLGAGLLAAGYMKLKTAYYDFDINEPQMDLPPSDNKKFVKTESYDAILKLMDTDYVHGLTEVSLKGISGVGKSELLLRLYHHPEDWYQYQTLGQQIRHHLLQLFYPDRKRRPFLKMWLSLKHTDNEEIIDEKLCHMYDKVIDRLNQEYGVPFDQNGIVQCIFAWLIKYGVDKLPLSENRKIWLEEMISSPKMNYNKEISRNYLKQYLESHPGWVLFIDCAPKNMKKVTSLLPTQGGIIFYSSTEGVDNSARSVSVKFNLIECEQLTKELLLKPHFPEDYQKLSKAFYDEAQGGLPIGIVSAADYINVINVSVNQYLQELSEMPNLALDFGEDGNISKHNTFKGIMLKLQRFIEQNQVVRWYRLDKFLFGSGPSEAEQLLYLLLLSSQSLPHDLLASAMSKLSVTQDDTQFFQWRNELVKHHLISLEEKPGILNPNLRIIHGIYHHVLYQCFQKKILAPPALYSIWSKITYLDALLEGTATYLRSLSNDNAQPDLLVHTFHLADLLMRVPEGSFHISNAANFLTEHVQYIRTLEMHWPILVRQKWNDVKYQEYRSQSEKERVIQENKILNIFINQRSLSWDLQMSLLEQLGANYGTLGETARAQVLFKKALEISLNHNSPSHIKTALLKYNLALTYVECDPDIALQLSKEALEMHQKYYGPSHWQTAIVQGALAQSLFELGKHQESQDLWEKVLAIQLNHYGESHWQVAFVKANLAATYFVLGNNMKAEDLLEDAVGIYGEHYGFENIQVTKMQYNLAEAYFMSGKFQQAKYLLEQTIKSHVVQFGRKDKQSLLILHRFACVLFTLGDRQNGLDLLEEVHTTYVAQNAPERILAACDLASACIGLGDYQKACNLLEKDTLNFFVTNYGREHKETAKVIYNLGQAKYYLGNVDIGKELILEAYLICRSKYGDNDNDTQIIKNKLEQLSLLNTSPSDQKEYASSMANSLVANGIFSPHNSGKTITEENYSNDRGSSRSIHTKS